MHHTTSRTIEKVVKQRGIFQHPLNSTGGCKYVEGNTVNIYYYSIS